MSTSVMYVGLDVHKETIAVAVAAAGRRAEIRDHGDIANTPAALKKLLGKLGGSGDGGREFRHKVTKNLLVVTLDASGRAGSAKWEPIPVSQRTVGDPDYVNNVLRQAGF